MRNMYSSIPTKDGLHEAKSVTIITDMSRNGLVAFTMEDGQIRIWQVKTTIKSIRQGNVRRVEAQGTNYVALIRSHFTNIIMPNILCRNFIWTGQQAQMIGANWGYWE